MENNIYDISDMHDDAISLCDKYDFLASVCIGGCAGAIDVFFVGEPGFSKLGKATDKAMDNIVMRFAKAVGWSPKDGKQGNVASAIGFLENKYRVNYDQSHTGQVGRRFQLTPKNHHLKSLAHSPDIIGLFFSILNQFTNTSSFVSNGKLITIQNSDTQFELQGHNFISRLYCGFCNWVGHIMSDIAGSSGSRGKQDCGRGMGVPVPFMELFQLCDFGKLRGKNEETTTLARVMEEVFVNGYDARYAVAMSIPVVLTWVRRILVVMYIGATVYGWINNYIKRWYVIIPSFLIMSFFMMWNLGGVKNCIIASAYRAKLNNLISRVNSEYDKYSSGVDRYNARNGLGFFNKVRKKRKVNLAWYGFNSSGINMFALEDAVFGVSTSVWKTKVGKLNKKISRISDKNDAIFADETISDERRRFNDVKKMNREMGYYNPDYDKISVELDSQKKKGIKAQKKILKKRI